MMWTLPISRRVVFGLCALFLFLFLGCKKEKPAAAEEEHAAPVKWEEAEKADLEEWTELLGITQPLPQRAAHISAPVGGYILSVLPSEKGKTLVEGQHVSKGQILVHLDDRVLRANREKLLVSDPELKEQIKQAAHTVELARIEVERLDKLQSRSGSSVPLVTHLEMERAHLALKDAESKQKVAQAKEDIARAEIKALDEQLTHYTLRSPIDGKLGMVHAHVGQTLALGATVAEIIDLDEIDILCFVPAHTVDHLELDQVVRIDTHGEAPTADPKLTEGRIVYISDRAQTETGTVAVKARFNNQKHKLLANMLVRVRVRTKKKSDCFSIPEAALLEDQEKTAVLVVETKKEKDENGEEKEEHHVHKFLAELGLRDRDKKRVEILGLIEVKEEKEKKVPLEHDTRFVVEGGHGLEDDDLVTLKKEEHEDEKKDEKPDEKKDEKPDEKKDEKPDEKKDEK
jgi:RND family efflux transporter MFP subunit